MLTLLYLAGGIAILSAILAISRKNAVHALLYLILCQLAISLVLALLGAPFAAVLEIIIYAGAVMVLFVFVVMMLNRGEAAVEQEREWMRPAGWAGPALLSAVLLGELVLLLAGTGSPMTEPGAIGPKEVGLSLLGPYLVGVELASILLLAALVGAYHLGRRNAGGNERGKDMP